MTKKKKNIFADIIIVICLLFCACITVSAIYEYHRLNVVMQSDVILALLGMWGGELLIIALRQIFGSDVIARAKNIKEGQI